MHLPQKIKAEAFARAMRRMREMAKTRVVKLAADRIDVQQKVVRARTTANFNGGLGAIEIKVRSAWIPLYALGAKEIYKTVEGKRMPVGVAVVKRGSYPHAFIANAGHMGVYQRETKNRYPIRELFGPNPAHDIVNNPDDYTKLLVDLIESSLLPRVLHELDRLLPN